VEKPPNWLSFAPAKSSWNIEQTHPTPNAVISPPNFVISTEGALLRRSGETPALAFSQPTSTSVISTGAQRSGETPVFVLAHPTQPLSSRPEARLLRRSGETPVLALLHLGKI